MWIFTKFGFYSLVCARQGDGRYGQPVDPGRMMVRGVIWDIDLDYFTQEEEVPDQQYTPMLGNRAIRSLLSPRKEWMRIILNDPKAITVAMEPEYTGGLSCSLELYRQWENIFFVDPLFSNECDWRDDLFGE